MAVPDEAFTLREQVMMERIADMAAEKMSETLKRDYPQQEYGARALRSTLEEYMGDMSPKDHVKQHKWLDKTMALQVAGGPSMDEKDFWKEMKMSAAKAMMYGMIFLVLVGIASWVRFAAGASSPMTVLPSQIETQTPDSSPKK